MVKATKPDKTRQLSIEQENALEHLLQGKSDRATAEAVGVSRQTVWEWRNRDPIFIAELNLRRLDLWNEARERLKYLTSKALDTLEKDLDCDDPKVGLAAAQFILKRMGEIKAPNDPITPEDVVYWWEKAKVTAEVEQDCLDRPSFLLLQGELSKEIERKAQERTKRALKEYGL